MDNTNKVTEKYEFEEALNAAGFGKYSIAMITSCCLLIVALGMDMFNVSVLLPAMACDLDLTTQQQGLISAISLIGVLLSSYLWGLCADMFGRRRVLMLSMPVGVLICMATSFAPTYASFVVLKFLSGFFLTSSNAAGFALLGETLPRRWRHHFLFLMSTVTMGVHAVNSGIAIPIMGLGFRIPITWLNVEYTPWRLALFVTALPGLIGVLVLAVLSESPKFLLSKGQEDQALEVLKHMYRWNTGSKKDSFPITHIYLDESALGTSEVVENSKTSFIRKMWNQTAPLLKPPLLKNSAIVYYIFFCAFMITTAFSMFVSTIANIYFSGDTTGKTFCDIASTISTLKTDATIDCDNVIRPSALYAVVVLSIGAVSYSTIISFLVKPMGKKGSTLLVFLVSTACGILLLFVKIPLLSLALFFMFNYSCAVLGNANSYLVELNPTHLRGMATCLSVIVARGFGFVSVQIIAALITDHCGHMIIGYVILVFSGFLVSLFLPADSKLRKETGMQKNSE